LNIYVCIKHVPDSAATITVTGPAEIDERITFLLNPYDENAVEAGVRLKPQFAGPELVAVTAGKAAAADTLRSALAMGADRGLHVVGDCRLDWTQTAAALAAAITRDGQPALVLTGKAAIDSEGGQTMFRLAARLGLPAATNAVAIERRGGALTVASELESGARQYIQLPLPGIVGCAKSLNQPRYPTFPDIVRARKKPIETIDLNDLCDPLPQRQVGLTALRTALEERRGEVLDGPGEAAVAALIEKLSSEARVI
jgi:electron transfer flavoprotein beta subunit